MEAGRISREKNRAKKRGGEEHAIFFVCAPFLKKKKQGAFVFFTGLTKLPLLRNARGSAKKMTYL
jgi:hypothetical protein